MQLGSTIHRDLFCQSFHASYLDYDPTRLPFPDLNPEQLALLQGIPFWEKARDTERRAGALVAAFAETLQDPSIREAMALQGREELRHARLIQTLIDRYSLPVNQPPEIKLPPQLDAEFVLFGFGECLDSFFAFGLFEIARQAELLPEALFTIFDPILDEEARHIVFFVNWFTYMQIQQGQGFLPLRWLKTGWGYSRSLQNLISAFTSKNSSGAGFTATNANAFALEITPAQFGETCLQENRRRMSQFDPALLQPVLLPQLCQMALRLKLWPSPQPKPTPV
jgi:hypothetical protein